MFTSSLWKSFQSSPRFKFFMRLMNSSQLPPEAFLQRIYNEAMLAVGYLKAHPDQKFAAKLICGMDFWSVLRKAEAGAAGVAFSFLVMSGALPLRFVSPPSSTNKLYSYWLE